jgi:hypothetical protein
MKKLIAAIAAAGVLVSGAFVATTLTGTSAQAQTTSDAVVDTPQRPARGAILDGVLGELVDAGTINQSQADAVKAALEAKREELKEKFGDRGPRFNGERRGVLRGLMADGVISADEIAALPDDHPLKNGEGPLAELLEDDGQITRDELVAFIEQRRAEREAAGEANG